MSWQLICFAILGVVLVVGFGWYEHYKPSSKIVAAVAILAALAALGRVAFAPIPNVKPTTDIVFIAGLTLGGAPGFMTGAVAAITSNIFFGQGPWTPWQMVAWGGVGVAGGLVGKIYRDRVPSRWTVASICAVLGLMFGLWMDFSTWIILTGDQTLKKFYAISASSLVFNVAHAVGNFVFAIVFGPIMIKALKRFRSRTETVWHGDKSKASGSLPTTLALLALLLPVLSFTTASPLSAATNSSSSVNYLVDAQNKDGGFGSADNKSSSLLFTSWAALGLAAGGVNPLDVSSHGKTPIDYIKKRAGQITDLAEVERTVLVLVAAGKSPKKFAGRNFVAKIKNQIAADGSIGGLVNTTAFGIMALRASGESRNNSDIVNAGRWLADQQNDDGGFNFSGKGGSSDVDMTAAAIEGLVAAGRDNTNTVENAIEFLKNAQNDDGGFPLGVGDKSNAQSTAWAVQAISAARLSSTENLRSRIRSSAVDYLKGLIEDNGRVRYSPTSGQTPVWVTAEVIPALEGKPFPLEEVKRVVKTRTSNTTDYPDYPTYSGGYDDGGFDTGTPSEPDILGGDDSSSSDTPKTSNNDIVTDPFGGDVDPTKIYGPPTPLTYDPKVAESVRKAGYVTSLLLSPLN